MSNHPVPSQPILVIVSVSQTDMARDPKLLEDLAKAEQAALPLTRCKIQIMGDSGVGKTSLRTHLLTQKVPKEHYSTVCLETLSVYTVDLNENWKQSASNLKDFYHKAAWWALRKRCPTGGGSLQIQMAETKGFTKNIMFIILWLGILIFPLQEGFKYAACTYGMAYGSMLYLISGQSRTARFLGSSMYFAMLYQEALLHKRLPLPCQDYTTIYRSEVLNIGSLTLGFLHMYLGPKGFILATIFMKSPGQLHFEAIFTNNPVSTINLNVSYTIKTITTSAGLPIAMLLALHTLFGGVKTKGVLKCTILLKVFWAMIHTIPQSVYAIDIITSSSQGISLCIGMSVARHFVISKRLQFLPKYILSTLTGFLYCYILGWDFQLSWTWIPGLIVLLHDLFYGLCPTPSPVGETFPINETLNVAHMLESGQTRPPLSFTLMDFGGNEEYTEMHHAFISEKAIYCVVFNLKTALQDFEKQFSRICYWLGKIKMHIPDKCCPKAFLIGTHRAFLNQNSVQSSIDNFSTYITREIQRSRLYEDWFIFNSDDTILFTVENTHTLSRDPGAIQLQKSISKVARTWLEEQGEYTLKMHRVIDMSKDLCTDGYNYLSTKQLHHKLLDNGITNLSYKTLVNYLIIANQMGCLTYQQRGNLKDWVILDCELLVYIMKRFLEPNPSWANYHPRQLKRLNEQGIITMKHLSVIIRESQTKVKHPSVKGSSSFLKQILRLFQWKDSEENIYGNKYDQKDLEFIVYYLQELGSIYELKIGDESNEQEFLVPSRLPHSKSDNLVVENVAPTFTFVIDCGENAVIDVFPKILAHYLKSNGTHYDSHKSLYRKTAVMEFPSRGMCIVQCKTEIFEQQLIEVSIYSNQENTRILLDNILDAFHIVFKENHVTYKVGVTCPRSNCLGIRVENGRKHILMFADNQMHQYKTTLNLTVWWRGVAVQLDLEHFTIKVIVILFFSSSALLIILKYITNVNYKYLTKDC